MPGDITMRKLHHIIQSVMGWGECHLHEFVFRGQSYGAPDNGSPGEVLDENKFKLCDLNLRKGSKIRYVYDFGDDWEHQLVIEEIRKNDKLTHQNPLCLGGERAGPPEDIGGPWMYQDLVEILRDPTHPQYAEAKESLYDEEFDPEACDLATLNAHLESHMELVDKGLLRYP